MGSDTDVGTAAGEPRVGGAQAGAGMGLRWRLLLGPLAAGMLLAGIAGLPLWVPGYDPVRQTVSEIGEAGSPARVPFAAMLCLVAATLVVFAWGLRAASRRAGRPAHAAWLVAAMSVSAAGVGVFAFPHPLHNLFGLSELIGYQAPLAMALTWRRAPGAERVAPFSAFMAGLVWAAIALNLTSLHREGLLWTEVKPVYGLIQRSLFAAWFTWCAVVGLLVFRWAAPKPALGAQAAVQPPSTVSAAPVVEPPMSETR